jgi:hypothetical protein
MDKQEKNQTPPVGTGPGSSGIENADMDRDLTADAETDKSAEAPGHDPAKPGKSDGPEKSSQDAAAK